MSWIVLHHSLRTSTLTRSRRRLRWRWTRSRCSFSCLFTFKRLFIFIRLFTLQGAQAVLQPLRRQEAELPLLRRPRWHPQSYGIQACELIITDLYLICSEDVEYNITKYVLNFSFNQYTGHICMSKKYLLHTRTQILIKWIQADNQQQEHIKIDKIHLNLSPYIDNSSIPYLQALERGASGDPGGDRRGRLRRDRVRRVLPGQ